MDTITFRFRKDISVHISMTMKQCTSITMHIDHCENIRFSTCTDSYRCYLPVHYKHVYIKHRY